MSLDKSHISEDNSDEKLHVGFNSQTMFVAYHPNEFKTCSWNEKVQSLFLHFHREVSTLWGVRIPRLVHFVVGL